ncbi:hypothetical protein TSUD_189160 [Trifolium subterraneum]|uniref:Reverse transcriptase zinc-binding domain-containing protein n=1 Tax=Trifolium subterraneum TaxID=3900 RepID=A0A2Z6NWS4_TRISU|nr:hypothetical protein TSUD_189160 [Trifolium subterraneum]
MLHPSWFNSFSNTRKRVMEALVKRLKSEAASNYSIKFIDHIHHAIFCLLVFMCFGEEVGNEKIEVIKHVQRLWIISSGKFGVLNYFPKAISYMLFRKRWNEYLNLQKDQKDEKRKLDDDELAALCSKFLTAGTDTTSSALEWVMANLVKYGHVQQRIVEEIREVVAHREEREVKEEDLEKLPYLKAVILEGLRRHSPSHYLIPHAVTEDVIFNGYLVPKNGTVNFMVAEVGWDPTAWEDPMAFKPERFEESSSRFDVTSQTEIKMMPFGAGRRICPAYHLAMLHLEYFVANMIWNFEWNTLSPESNVDLSSQMRDKMGLPLVQHLDARICGKALFLWEEDLVVRLREVLASANLSCEDDGWSWLPDPDGVFTVKSTYLYLAKELRSGDELDEGRAVIFDQIWDSAAPSKVIAFSWQLLYDRIPSRKNLNIRGILGTEVPWECVGCVGSVESCIHLFLHCPSAMMVWYDIFRWLGLVIVIPPSLFSLFEVMRARNGAIFANGSFIPKVIVDEIKVMSWKWSLTRMKVSPCLFYEWTWDPGDCLQR